MTPALRWGICLLACLGFLLPLPARADDVPLALELVLNGRTTDAVGQFVQRGQQILATPDDLRSLGFAVPEGESRPLIPLTDLPGVSVRLNGPQQTLEVTASDAALQPTLLAAGRRPPLAPLAPSDWGMVTNYDLEATRTNDSTTGGALLESRLLGPYGTLSSGTLSQSDPGPQSSPWVRLDTTYAYPDPDAMRRWRSGDVVTGALSWTRAVRLGGAQLATDFGMRPDLITYPVPSFGGSAAVPSTVDLMVNGTRAYSASVQPGPFEIASLPTVNGAGEAVVAVTNALGQQTLATVPFYITSDLLKPGLTSYSLEGGAARHDYGVRSDAYGSGAASLSLRHGLTDWLTLEGHGEATSGIGLAGLGVVVRVGDLGVLSASAAGSRGRQGDGFRLAGPAGGALFGVGFQRATPQYDLGLSLLDASRGYRDLAAAEGTAYPRKTVIANLGIPLGRAGHLNLTYINRHTGSLKLASGHLPGWDTGVATSYSTQLTSQVSVGYTVPLTDSIAFMATGYIDPHDHKQFGLLAGLTFSLGGVSASTLGTAQNRDVGSQASLQRTAISPGDIGYQLADTEGANPQRTAQGQYISPWGRVSAGVSQYGDAWAGRVGASGALVLMDGGVFAADQISDSFAIVKTGGLAGVHVSSENRAAGETDSSGRLLVPDLRGYDNNSLAIDADDIPPDYEVNRAAMKVRPGDTSGVVVDFGVRPLTPAVLRLVLPDGRPVPLRSEIRLDGDAGPARPIGHDGQAYVTHLKDENRAVVTLPDGRQCRVRFPYHHVPGEMPTIGPLKCR